MPMKTIMVLCHPISSAQIFHPLHNVQVFPIDKIHNLIRTSQITVLLIWSFFLPSFRMEKCLTAGAKNATIQSEVKYRQSYNVCSLLIRIPAPCSTLPRKIHTKSFQANQKQFRQKQEKIDRNYASPQNSIANLEDLNFSPNGISHFMPMQSFLKCHSLIPCAKSPTMVINS